MSHLGESIHHREDDRVSIREQKPSDEIQGDMRSGAMGTGSGCRSPPGHDLRVCFDYRPSNKVSGVFLQHGLPETLEDELLSASGTRMTGEVGGMGPLQDVGP